MCCQLSKISINKPTGDRSLKRGIVHRSPQSILSLIAESPSDVGYCSGVLGEICCEDSVWELLC
ncbi:hypothetical protein [Nostoc sp.]|uniref:hypothetical protein n=1 Tax=Nostoc sp. TaxID=1180 RepID=UPI002FF71FE7